MTEPTPTAPPLSLLSVVIPARNEEGCISSTVEHLHVELRLHDVPHQIIVVDDGSTDKTWPLLVELQKRIPTLSPSKTWGRTGLAGPSFADWMRCKATRW